MTDNNLVHDYESYFRVAEKKDVLKDAWSFPNGEAQILLPETILGCIQDFKNEHNKGDFLANFLADFDVYSGYFKLHSNPLTFICILSLMLDLKVFLRRAQRSRLRTLNISRSIRPPEIFKVFQIGIFSKFI